MYPNQPQPPAGTPPQQPPYGDQPSQNPTPTPMQPPAPQFTQPVSPPQASAPQPLNYAPQPSTPPSYDPRTPAQPTFAVDYLDQIAPPPPQASFLSGGFGKIIIAMAILFLVAVSIIVALGGQKKTADLEQVVSRLDNFQKVVQVTKNKLKNQKLRATNANFQTWIGSATNNGQSLLDKAGVQKNQMDKKMLSDEKTITDGLTSKFTDAALNANLDQVYANEMSYQAKLMIVLFSKMSKTSQAKAIRDYAKQAGNDLTPIQKQFEDFRNDSTIGN